MGVKQSFYLGKRLGKGQGHSKLHLGNGSGVSILYTHLSHLFQMLE